MKTINLNYGGRKLPAYLGYGILDASSIQFENDVLTVNYVFESDGSLVHQVVWEKDRCYLNTLCHGKQVRRSIYPNLKQALLSDCMSWTLYQDDCFLFLSKEVSELGNIYVNHPRPDKKETSLSYYPAGKLFLFSLPMVSRTSDYISFLEKIQDDPYMRFYRERKGLLIRADKQHKVSLAPVIIADFVVPLAHLVSAAKTMVASGIIEKEKQWRLIANEAMATENTLLQIFPGTKAYPYFGICFKELEGDKYQALADIFILQAEGLLPLQNAN